MRRDMPLALPLALVIMFILMLASSALAQHRLDVDWPVSLNPEAQAQIEEGNELLAQQEFGEARVRYETAVELVRRDGEFPATPLHQIAVSYYYEGKPMMATRRLDELAEEAAAHGDIVTQVWALADCAWVHGKAGAKIDMEERIDRLRRVLKSPYLPYEVRSEVTSKRLGEATTFVSGT